MDTRQKEEHLQKSTPPKKVKKTATQRKKEWVQKLKVNQPEKYEAYLEKRRASEKARRANFTPEQIAYNREATRLRMQELARRRRKDKSKDKENKPMSKMTLDEKRQLWKEKKRIERENMTSQKRRRVKEKRRLEYRLKKEAEMGKLKKSETSIPEKEDANKDADKIDPSTLLADPRTPAAIRKARSRAKAGMPNSPRRFYHTHRDLAHHGPPGTRQLFEQSEAHTVEYKIGKEVIRQVKKGNKKRSKKSLMARRILLSACGKYEGPVKSALKIFGVTNKTLSMMASDGLLNKVEFKRMKKEEEEVTAFFESASHPLPYKKRVSMKTGQPTCVLSRPLRDLYEDYKNANPDKPNISFSHFASCRPKHIKPMSDARLQQCLCEYCTNVNLKLKVLNAIASRVDNACRVRHTYHAVDLVTCGRENGRWRKACAHRECQHCKDKTVHTHCRGLLRHQGPVTWFRWEAQKVVLNGKKVGRPYTLIDSPIIHYNLTQKLCAHYKQCHRIVVHSFFVYKYLK